MKLLLLLVVLAGKAHAQPASALRLELAGADMPAILDARPGCGGRDIPDAPARAIRLRSGEVQLYAADQDNRLNTGPDLLHVRHRCPVVLRGTGNDDPAAYDDRTWIASPWTPDGNTVFAIVHNEFQGHRRPALCPSGRYMDCWFNTLTAAVSEGGGPFRRMPGNALVAALPYRFGELGLGHKGYFNSSNIVSADGAQYMFAFATRAGAQQPGNCLLRTNDIANPAAWRGWDGSAFVVAFINPYTDPAPPAQHVCAPVATGSLRWPVTSLVRHGPSGMFIALMQDTARNGGIYYVTSLELLRWSAPALLMTSTGPGTWTCTDPAPLAYPSLLDPASTDQNFETVGASPMLFATRFTVRDCRTGLDRELVRWPVRIHVP